MFCKYWLFIGLLSVVLSRTSPPAFTDNSFIQSKQITFQKYQTLGLSNLIVTTVGLQGGKQARLLLDTGSSSSYISTQLCRSLGLTPKPALDDKGKPILLKFNGNKPAEAVTLTRLSLGSIPLDDVPIFALNADTFPTNSVSTFYGQPIDGILGINVLRFLAIIIDTKTQNIAFTYPGNLDTNALKATGFDPALSAEIVLTQDLAYLDVNVNNEGIERLAIDTASETTAISAKTAKKLKTKPIGQTKTQHSAFGDLELHRTVLKALEFGGIKFDDLEVLYPDDDDKRIPARVGIDTFQQNRVLLDFPAKRIYFGRRVPAS